MDVHCDCDACNARTVARSPTKAFWMLIVAFWVASFATGFFSARADWTLVLFATWAAVGASVVLFARRATTWTCAECGSSVSPPAAGLAPPLTGSYRRAHAQTG